MRPPDGEGHAEALVDLEREVDAGALHALELGADLGQLVEEERGGVMNRDRGWDEVNQAQQQRDRMINEARGEYNRVIPRARGEAQQTVLQAEGYALDRVNRAQGDAVRFTATHAEYRRAPDVTRRRLYLETMQRVLPTVGRKLYVDKDTTGVLPLLSLDDVAPRPVSAALPAAGGDQ